MAVINFPTSPGLYQTFTFGTKVWVWNGYAWDLQASNSSSFLANTGSQITLAGNSIVYVANTQASSSNTTGALIVNGGLGVKGNVYSDKIYTNGLYYASNGNPIQTGGGGGSGGFTTIADTLGNTISYTTNTTVRIVGGPGITVAANATNPISIAISTIPGQQGLTVDWGLVADALTTTYDFGSSSSL